MAADNNSINIDWSYSTTVTTTGISVHYRIRNREHQAVFVARVVTDARRELHANSAYASLAAADRHLVLTLGTCSTPRGKNIEVAVSPLYIRLDSGQEDVGTLFFQLPIDEWDAYHLPIKESRSETVLVNVLDFTVEVIPAKTAIDVIRSQQDRTLWNVVGWPIKLSRLSNLDSSIAVRKWNSGLVPTK